MESAMMQFELLNSNTAGANLCVLGLTVAERNRRHLCKLGLEEWVDSPQPSFQTKPKGLLKFAADQQILVSTYKTLIQVIQNNPKESHQFQNANGQILPIEWDAGLEAVCTKHVVDWKVFDTTHLLTKQHEMDVKKELSKTLFAEIFAGTEGWIARGLNKKISFRMTEQLVKTPITPNQITIGNLILGLLGCLCFLSLSFWVQCFGAILLQLNSIVDGCDGEVARLKVITSKIGGWLDTIADDILNNVMFVCLVWGLYNETQSLFLLRFGQLSVLASLGVTFFIYQNLIANRSHNAAHFKLSWEKPSAQMQKKSWFDVVKPLLKRDFFIFVVCVCVILNVRKILLVFLVPMWGAFFLYLASFIHSLTVSKQSPPQS